MVKVFQENRDSMLEVEVGWVRPGTGARHKQQLSTGYPWSDRTGLLQVLDVQCGI